MEIKEIGEFGLIRRISANSVYTPETVVTGIGDDAAVLRATPGQHQLVTTDMLVEGIHFKLDTISPWQLGYKAVAVNLSDIAAMGGIPRHILVSLGISPGLTVEFIDQLYGGMKEICRKYGVNIVGGDTVRSPLGLVINITATGEAEPAQIVYRSGARPGDVVMVTGTLGAAAAGLCLLERPDYWEHIPDAAVLINTQLTPEPRVREGRMLAAAGVSSMNDISDGLASEINEIAQASGVGAKIYSGLLPLLPGTKMAAGLCGKRPEDLALYGGEDYQLVFTVSKENTARIRQLELGIAVSAIGEIVPEPEGVLLINNRGAREPLLPRGYNHFSAEESR